MSARTEVLDDGAVGREKALSVTGGLGSLPAPLALTGGLM